MPFSCPIQFFVLGAISPMGSTENMTVSLVFVFIVVIFCYVSFIVSGVKLFVRHTLCIFFQLYELIAHKL